MKIKNNSNKIISLGVLSVLPGKTETLPKEYENHPVLEMLKSRKMDNGAPFITLTATTEKKAAQKAADEKETKASAKAKEASAPEK